MNFCRAKKRNFRKPLAICVDDVKNIVNYGEIEHLPRAMLNELLPGPRTIVVKRKESLPKYLNRLDPNVGIRVPNSPFIRLLCEILQQPLALTSANESNEMSTVHPGEFEALWPKLTGIFYNQDAVTMSNDKQPDKDDPRRAGSTVVDLTEEGVYKILREGMALRSTEIILQKHCFKRVN